MTSPDPYPLHESVSGLLGPAAPGLAIVQSKIVAANALTLSFNNPTTAGNCVVVGVGCFQATSGMTPSVTGMTLGGSADHFAAVTVPVSAYIGGFYALAGLWIDPNCAGGQTAVAVTGVNLPAANSYIAIYEVSGLPSSGLVDQTAAVGASVGGTAFSSGATPATTQASEIWFGVAFTIAGITTTPGAPWTNLEVGSQFLMGSQIVTATGTATYAGVQNAADGWAALAVTLKAAPPPAATPGSVTLRISPGQPGAPGSGVGASRNSGLTWNVTGVAVSVAPLSGNTAPVLQAQCAVYISYGIQSATPDDFQGQTQTGSTGDTCTVNATLRPGDWITIVWTGGDPGARATARIFGTVTPPGVK